jgi:hypothetical protein
MSSTRQNKIITITNDEAYDLATHLARMADSTNVIINVSSQAEADALPSKYAGLAVRRLDIGVTAVDVWTGSAWFGARVPFAHMGRADGFQTITTFAKVQMSAAQKLQGGFTFDNANDLLVVPVTGQYRISMALYTSGSGTGIQMGYVYNGGAQVVGVRYWKGDAGDYCHGITMTKTLTASDGISLQAQLTGTAMTTWGTDGYNGSFVELEYMGPA